ncbi:hypothetical protein [Anaerofustis sp.]|uniref:hypothetical protein n=1 Tax=Anaerofustis sp. TaxID=1872517 RepID=UPI0025C54CC3|nr:hypothetical protein [Anaerofustis sp.]
MPKYDAIILGLDGSKKFFELGSFTAFLENKMRFKAVSAGGMGIINACFLVCNDINQAIKFWTMAINTDLFKINEIIADIYENEWSKLDDTSFVNSFTKFLSSDKRLYELKKALKKYISEDDVRKSDVELYIDTINLSNLNFEAINLKSIPFGQFHSYILLSLCFPEISRVGKSSGLVNSYNNNLVNILVDKGYKNILSLEETIEPLSFRKVTLLKSSDFLEAENSCESKLMKEQIMTGYLDTLKSIGKVSGKIYYIDYIEDDDYKSFDVHIGDLFSDNKDYLIMELLGLNVLNKNLVRKSICDLIKFSEFRKENNALLSLLENLACIFHVEEKKKYTFFELKNEIIKSFKSEAKMHLAKIGDRDILNSIIYDSTPVFYVDKDIFMDYFLILISAKPENYHVIAGMFSKVPDKIKLGIVALIYLLY